MTAGPRLSMRVIVIGATVAIVAAAVVAVGAMAERNTRRALTREAEARLLLEARHLALAGNGALLSELPELTLHPMVRELTESRPELSFAVVADHRGVVQGHRDARSLGSAWKLPAGLSPVTTTARLRDGESLLGGRDLLVAVVPVTSATGQRLGTVSVGLRRAYVEREVAAARRQQILLVAAVLAAGIALAFLLLTALLKPIAALRAGLERIGRGDLDTPIVMRDRTELGLLADTVNDMAHELKVAQREVLEKERLAHEVALARDIQQRLLPRGARAYGEFELHGAQQPAAEVGGDYYDVLPRSDGRVLVVIADVAGKGLGGCLVMSMLSASLRAIRNDHASPAALLVALEEQLLPALEPGEFVTMLCGLLDPGTGSLTFASAGHTPLLVRRAATGASEWHSTRGIPLGVMRNGVLRGTLQDHALTIAPGDVLLHFTDGCSEAANASGEEFGYDRIAEVVASHAGEPESIGSALSRAVAAWTGGAAAEDDQTVLVLARPAAAAGAPVAAPASALEAADPLERLAVAERAGHSLVLDASFDALDALGDWIAALPDVRALEHDERLLVETAMYELCANVVEHGSAGLEGATLDVHWVSAPRRDGDPADDAARVPQGWFVLRDHGYPFRPGRRRPFDGASHSAWRRGRGLGLDIVHLALSEVVFRPGTPAGNITLLAFDPAKARPAAKEHPHG